MEATGVELLRVLIARKLLIPGTATRAKNAPLPDPLYVHCTKMFFATRESRRRHKRPQYPIDLVGSIEKKHPSFLRYRK